MNKVIAGNYKGSRIFQIIGKELKIYFGKGFDITKISIDPLAIKHFEIIESQKAKNPEFNIGTAIAGDLMFGPWGLLLGTIGQKPTKGYTRIGLEFHDGAKCIIELDEKFMKVFHKLFLKDYSNVNPMAITISDKDLINNRKKNDENYKLLVSRVRKEKQMRRKKELKTKINSFFSKLKF